MATAGGAPPTGASPKPKREFTPEQKRTFGLLGVAGALALIVGVMYVPSMLSGGGGGDAVPVAPPPSAGTGTANTATATLPVAPPDGAGVGANAGGAVTAAAPSAAAGAGQAQPVVFISRARVDPFRPMYLSAPPVPTPIPTVPDPQIIVSAPGGTGGFGNGGSIGITDPRVRAAVAAPLRIGLPIIPQLDSVTNPRDVFPLPRTAGEGTAGAPQQSYDKRLAGIIIGDGVRALLELPSGEQRVVQPGDEVEGIRILNIERFRQGDRTTSRMLVRDTDGTQRYVELKPAPQAAAGAEGGVPGA